MNSNFTNEMLLNQFQPLLLRVSIFFFFFLPVRAFFFFFFFFFFGFLVSFFFVCLFSVDSSHENHSTYFLLMAQDGKGQKKAKGGPSSIFTTLRL